MAKMGRYCKAYPVERFREFSGWTENTQNMRKEKQAGEGKEAEATAQPAERDYFFLQENFVVTDGIFLDENIIFDNVTPEWIDFCKNSLGFEVPPVESAADGKSGQENMSVGSQ
jgi:hypothetical protein